MGGLSLAQSDSIDPFSLDQTVYQQSDRVDCAPAERLVLRYTSNTTYASTMYHVRCCVLRNLKLFSIEIILHRGKDEKGSHVAFHRLKLMSFVFVPTVTSAWTNFPSREFSRRQFMAN